MNKQTVEDYANNLFHPFKETAIIKRSDVIKTLNKAIQQERTKKVLKGERRRILIQLREEIREQERKEIAEWVKNAPKLLTHASMQDAIEDKPKRETLDANDLLEYLNNK